MPQWLVVNPNTSETVTQALVHHLSVDTPRRRWHGVTAAFGAPYIADERSYCIAGHAVLDAWERAQAAAPPQGYAGVLVGCFGDPGLEALRSTAPVPVRGLAEASLQALWAQGPQRIAIVTGGAAWKPMLQRWSRAQGHALAPDAHGAGITDIHVLPASGAQLMQSPEQAAQALAAACAQALDVPGTDAVLIGGAGLAGMGARVRDLGGAPVWDCVELVRDAWAPHSA